MNIMDTLEQRTGADASVRYSITGTRDCAIVRDFGVVVYAGTKAQAFGFVGEAQGRAVPGARR